METVADCTVYTPSYTLKTHPTQLEKVLEEEEAVDSEMYHNLVKAHICHRIPNMDECN